MSKKGRRGRSNKRGAVGAAATKASAPLAEGASVEEIAPELAPPPPVPEPAEIVQAQAPVADDGPRLPAETPVAFVQPEVPEPPAEEEDAAVAEAAYQGVAREDSSYPPVDLDNHFFDHGHRSSDLLLDEEERDPRMALKLTPLVAQRRAHLTKYVKMAVAGASVLCLAALVKVAVARSSADTGARRTAPVAAAVAPPPQTAVAVAPTPVAPAAPATEPVPSATQTAAAPATPPPPPAETAPAAPPADTTTAAAASAAPPSDTAGAAPAASEPDPKAAAKEKSTCRAALERGKLADAIEAGERSVSLDPTDSEAWLILGAAYQEKGNMKDARRCYRACIEQGKRGPKYECMAMPH
jgi:hypothetical protein